MENYNFDNDPLHVNAQHQHAPMPEHDSIGEPMKHFCYMIPYASSCLVLCDMSVISYFTIFRCHMTHLIDL